MKRLVVTTAIGIVAAGGLTAAIAQTAAPAPRAAMAPQAAPNAALPTTTALVRGYVSANKTNGIVAAIGRGDAPPTIIAAGKLSEEANAGTVDGNSLWRVYSMTKPIAAIAAMMLIEDGKLKLDQPIAEMIPAFKNTKVLVNPEATEGLASRPAARPITVRHLMTHTAGLGYIIITKGPLLKEYERLGLVPAQINAAAEIQLRKTRPATLEAFANAVAQAPLIADPGTKWSYSIGLDVLGRVVEVASGMSFDGFLKARLFDPLGMRSTFFSVPAADVGRLASVYTFVGENRVPSDPAATSVYLQKPSFPYGGAGLVMSATDYDRFLHMLQNGGTLGGKRVMKPETVKLAMSNLLPAGVAFRGVGGETGGSGGQGFGAGGSVALTDTPGGPGAGTYGWGGAAGTIAWVDPKNQVRGTVMVNYFPANKYPLREETMRAVYADVQRR